MLAAAAELDSPVIIQTSLKTVKSVGATVLYKMFRAMADDLPVPVDAPPRPLPRPGVDHHVPQDRWNSVLFDGSHLDVAENTRQTAEVVEEARAYDAQVEGEIETVRGVEDDVGSEEGGGVHPVEVSAQFIEKTGVYAFAPAIGTAHGLYADKPDLMPERVTQLVDVHPLPMVLHGGTGLRPEQFHDLIARGCAKVNISTALKITFIDSSRDYLDAEPHQARPAVAVRARPRGRAGDGRAPHPHVRLGRQGVGGPGRRVVTALIFDCDGVLADTERFGHLPAFNQTFADVGLPVRWTDEEYAEKLKIGGGKERMASLLTPGFVRDHGLPADPDGQRELLAGWHKRKTAAYKAIVAEGRLPARPGIVRIVDAAIAAGWTLAVASTSATESVERRARAHGRPRARRPVRGARGRHRAEEEARSGHLCGRARAHRSTAGRDDRRRGLAQRPARGRPRRAALRRHDLRATPATRT